MADVDVGDVLAVADRTAHRLVDRAERRAPADDRQLGALTAEANLLVRDGVRDAEDLADTRIGHLLVDFRAIIDVAGAGRLLDSADAVLETRRSRLDPRTSEVLVARIRHDAVALRRSGLEEADWKGLVVAGVRHAPRLRGIRDIAVGQEDDGRHVAGRDAAGLDRAIECVGG